MRSPGMVGRVDCPALPGLGDAGMSSPVGWLGRGGGEAAVGAAGQLPAALMHGPVMDPAQQGQVGQVGGAAMQPMLEVMGLAPGQGPVAVGENTAAVTDGQGGALGRLDDPGGPSHL